MSAIPATGVIRAMIAVVYAGHDDGHGVETALRHSLLEFSEPFLFLLAAMTCANAMDERNVFEALRTCLVRKGFSYRGLFWLIGMPAFFLSPIPDKLNMVLLCVLCCWPWARTMQNSSVSAVSTSSLRPMPAAPFHRLETAPP